MESQIEIYKTADDDTEITVKFQEETVWLNRNQLSELFDRDVKTIGKHVNNIFREGELEKDSVVAKFATTAKDGKTYSVDHYNLDVIISVGYRVKSKRGTQFRQWATKRLKDYLIKGYAINEKRLKQKNQEVLYLKTGIKILGRMIEEQSETENNDFLKIFANGLSLLDDYDHETLENKGRTTKPAVYPDYDDYLNVIDKMYSEFESDVFAKPKDQSFHSSINQIRQAFGDTDVYPSIEEKAASLLYFIVKNHSFVDGNKRIAAACFLYFLEQNKMLFIDDRQIITNEALASLTLFIATSKRDEMETVKNLVITILNRNK